MAKSKSNKGTEKLKKIVANAKKIREAKGKNSNGEYKMKWQDAVKESAKKLK